MAVPDSNTQISSLPTEILTNIFSYLSVRDKGRVARVCTEWRDTVYQKSLWRDNGIEAVLNSDRIANPSSLFTSLRLRGIKRVTLLRWPKTSSPSSLLFDLVQAIPTLKSLRLTWSQNNVTDLDITRAFVQEVPSMLELSLSDCTDLTDISLDCIVQHLKNLEVLELECGRHFTDASLILIVDELRRLKVLVLVDCCQVTDQGIEYVTYKGRSRLRTLLLFGCDNVSDVGMALASSVNRSTH